MNQKGDAGCASRQQTGMAKHHDTKTHKQRARHQRLQVFVPAVARQGIGGVGCGDDFCARGHGCSDEKKMPALKANISSGVWKRHKADRTGSQSPRYQAGRRRLGNSIVRTLSILLCVK